MSITRRLALVLFPALAVATPSCGGNVVVDTAAKSTGGATTTTTTSTTTTTTTATTGAGGSASGCTNPADCSTCPDYASCSACNLAMHPAGIPFYMALDQCHHCYTCFSSCAAVGCDGTPGPMLSPCDSISPSAAACDACLVCADKGTYCKGPFINCMADQDCMAIMNGIGKCPGK